MEAAPAAKPLRQDARTSLVQTKRAMHSSLGGEGEKAMRDR